MLEPLRPCSDQSNIMRPKVIQFIKLANETIKNSSNTIKFRALLAQPNKLVYQSKPSFGPNLVNYFAR